ncbi:site-specific integrase [Celeribacter sp. SCSIO 80788]|uniref:site-specific integrase n=1 Tax=Celeribacter sp. SCSIO 80788 TaxID=3117013 RepID=UPI003DA3151D
MAADGAVEHFIRESLSENTRKAYRSDLAHFTDWGGVLPATPDQVARYLADHADTLAPSSLARRVATLSKVHEANAWPNPCRSEIVRATMRGIKRVKGTAQDQASPLLREELFIVLDALGDDPRAKRDRALLLIGWAGGFRSSELIGLDLPDIEEVREGLVLHLRRSKTDQAGQGRNIGIPLGRTRHCPVAALSAWLGVLNKDEGPIYRPVDRHGNVQPDRLRSDAVSTILRNRLANAGIDPEGYSGHSLRAGLATSAIKAGVPTYKVRAQTGHASDLMLSRYVRDAGLFDGNAAGALL